VWNTEPYSWFYQTEVFSPEFYQEMMDNLPDTIRYRRYGGKYKNRYLFNPQDDHFWNQVDLMFRDVCGVSLRIQLCRDFGGYCIGPHTDGRKETQTILFYLPKDGSKSELGTSVYVPKDKTFTCDGSKHHDFDKFDKLFTAEYKPNTCFGFIRSDNSFHGVEPSTSERNLMQVSVWR
jgi:hypothetical protein